MVERNPKKLGWLVNLLCKVLPYKEIGWEEIEEVFFRWVLFKCAWFEICLHRLDAPYWHSQCHDHPWNFFAIILWGGYWEQIDPAQKIYTVDLYRNHHLNYKNTYWRSPGSLLYRPAETRHNVATQRGTPNWSIVFMSAKYREWGIKDCRKETV